MDTLARPSSSRCLSEKNCPLRVNRILPEGVPASGASVSTCAVKVTDCPTREGFREDLSKTWVAAPPVEVLVAVAVLVGGTGVLVAVSVGATGVLVAVSVGSTGVLVAVSVGGAGVLVAVLVAGTGVLVVVLVGGTAVLVAVLVAV